MTRHYYTPAEVARLQRDYPHTRTKDLADAMGLSERSVYSKADSLGLKKTDAYRQAERIRQGQRLGRCGSPGRFQPGHATWNKGMKGLEIGGKATRFQPGQQPHNARPIGHQRVAKEGYLERKVTEQGPRRHWYQAVHRLVWIAANGPIPDGHIVVFINGNKTDIRLENLELITRREHARRNSKARFPPALQALIQQKAVLTRKLNQLQRQAHDQ